MRRNPCRWREEPFGFFSRTNTATASPAFRIAQVIRNAAGIPILNPRFVAPCLDLASSTYLTMLLRRQIEILATKSATLSAPRRQRGKVLAEFSPSETANFWLLHTVNSYLPELKHIWKVRHGHPEPAYVAMLRLAGALATFSLEAVRRIFPTTTTTIWGGASHCSMTRFGT